MPYSSTEIKSIDEYINQYDDKTRDLLHIIKKAISKVAPEASEKISWQMPTFYHNGNLIHFAMGKNHVGIYPGAEAIEAFKAEFDERGLKYSKGAVQLPLSKEIPLDLIQRITTFNLENANK